MSVIIANIIILFAFVAFLIVKAAWQVILPICFFILAYMVENTFWKWKFYKSFSFWRALILQKLSKFGAKIINLKTIYIFFAAIIGFALLILFIALYSQISSIISGSVKTTISTIDSNFALAFLGTVSGGVALFTGYMAILRSGTNERETRTAEEGLITERLTKATEGLGKKDGDKPVIEVRLGALYALERIAQDSIRDHVQIMEILCAYVRHNSPLKSKPKKKLTNAKTKTSSKKNEPARLREDIQAALTIIGRRGHGKGGTERLEEEETQEYCIDLSHCDLSEALLTEANFSNARLQNSNLTHVAFMQADLSDTWMKEATLNDTWFSGADISGAWLDGAKMVNTRFEDTITARAHAHKGNFSKCINLTQEQVNQMFCGNTVKLPAVKVPKTNKLKVLDTPNHWTPKQLSFDEFEKERKKWLQKNHPEHTEEDD